MTRWDPEKNKRLKRGRGVSFEELMAAEVLVECEHPVRHNQGMLLVLLNDYVWVIPFVDDGGEMFLKTAFPSRKYTKRLLRGESL
ncbi:MAG: hypothetical protein A2X31_01930 [Elusimicrobia bacterium GWB2_63_22]|nr:MAG: hypothetical protein A2X31_01930 [Elusimicrobia bacterium GWB2_63_22]